MNGVQPSKNADLAKTGPAVKHFKKRSSASQIYSV